MGPSSSAGSFTTALTSQYMSQYGGIVQVDSQQGVVYQIWEDCGPEFDVLIAKRLRLKHKNLVTVEAIEKLQSSLCTGNGARLKLKYQLRNYNLEHELKKYCKQKKIFPERRLIRIIREVADCLQYLKLNETCHGDVKLSSIFLRDERPAQILDSYFIHKGRTAFEIVLDNAQSQSFLSPEQLGLMRDRMFPKLECIHASEVYSLGLTMVEVTTVQAALECYNLQTLEIHQKMLKDKHADILSYGYSRELADLIMSCVQTDPSLRPNFYFLLKTLAQLDSDR